ncbi:alanine--tRNA ligase [Angelakisella massiliensis]|uniref:alanine--tRNA ligase n=1 Tax=Angelakisella massiliensis TaxID=1871018 RepID=UPI0024B07FD1|nr:alanine--tRNA ligase [Angelakisella massiliensis]
MKWTGLNELREKFLSFYVSKGHTRLPSAPLVPQDEASLLLINSGMAPLKKYFMGLAELPDGNHRATSCQKCIRTPDIENVGHTARHGTYFEMLGNFSFGDYFKEEATTWAWEFCTKVLELPVDRLYVSVFEDDDEAYEIWTKRRGVDPSHMVRMGREDNFWEIGSGPCGPCSEIYFDRGPDKGCGKPDCHVGCECDRFVEFWNLVFTQFNSDGEGHYTPLEHPNIDTGMGLERLACIMQGVDNLFEVDTVQNIMKHICAIAGVEYKKDPQKDISIRVVTDHIRSTTFMIGDGVVPQNEGRGYVLRRLLRRAARHGRLLGINEPFLYKVCETVIKENENAYPDLVQNKDYIIKVIKMEEERFAKTIDGGLAMVNATLDRLQAEGKNVFPGDEAFKLYDTYGFPIDLTREIAAERNVTVDEETFNACMKVQRETAREATRAALGDVAWTEDVLKGKEIHSTFVGYQTMETEATVEAILYSGELTDSVGEGDEATIILSQTPFYAESGGQVGDKGVITCGDTVFEVEDCKKTATGYFAHMGRVKHGVLSTGDTVKAEVNKDRRRAIMRNHSACHLLQSALQSVLGNHVHQAGSYVDDHTCRFDFSHFSAMTAEEIKLVERKVNEMILAAHNVTATEMPIEEARKLGAMALFGEKYGNIVRVVRMEDCSLEFCGGTHVDNTAKLGLFKILKESSVAAGIRRIEATTGWGVLDVLDQDEKLLSDASAAVKAGNHAELPERVTAMAAELKSREKALAAAEQKLASMKVDSLCSGAKEVGGFRVICANVDGTKPEALRTLCDTLRANHPDMIAILGTVCDGKGNVAVSCGADAVKAGVHAGKLVKAITAITGGGGGGRPDSAMGGVGDASKIPDAAAQMDSVILDMLKK